MKLYADLPGRRTVQLLSDVGVLCWIAVCVWLGRVVHDAFATLARPGQGLISAGSDFHDKMTAAGDAVDNLPIIDDRVAEPFRSVAGTGTRLEQAGQQFLDAVGTTATVLGWTTALVPIVIVVGIWAILRGRFIRRATTAQRFIDNAADLDLFALRALAHQPMAKLARVSDDPGGAWRRGEAAVIRELGLLELRDSGLRPPRG